MFVCKWCRETIKPVHGKFDARMPDWIHTTNVYSCRYRPENIAAPADTRWETVHASIDKSEYGHRRYEVVLQYFGKRVSIVHRASEFELSHGYDPMLYERLMLGDLIDKMDEIMSRMPDGG